MKRKSALIKLLEKQRAKIAKARDELRDVMDEYEELLESTNTALNDLDACIDTLSQFA